MKATRPTPSRTFGGYRSVGEFKLDEELQAELERRRRVGLQRIALGLLMMFGGFAIATVGGRYWSGPSAVWALGWLGVMLVGIGLASVGARSHSAAARNLSHGRFESFELGAEAIAEFQNARVEGKIHPDSELARKIDIYPRSSEIARIERDVIKGSRPVRVRE